MHLRFRLWMIAALILLTGVLSACAPASDQPRTQFIDFTVEASYNRLLESVEITNRDTFAWTDVRLEINDVYSYRLRGLPAGQTVGIELRDFTRPDGRRLDPAVTKLLNINVSGRGPDGKIGSWLGRFGQ